MFPEDNIDETLKTLAETINTSENVLKSFEFNFDTKEFVVKDGSPVLIEQLQATKQWIQKFFATDLGTLEIYDGYTFGTSYKKLIGSKNINNALVESEIERETRTGLLLCPSIKKVISYESEKNGTKLAIRVVVALNEGASAECRAELDM